MMMMDDLDFVVLGLARCWRREEEGLLQEVLLIEPVPSAAFLLLLQRIPSSFSLLSAVDPRSFEPDVLPDGFPQHACFPLDFQERLTAAARTFQHNPEAKQFLGLGESVSLNVPLKQKRIINSVRIVSEQDNVKQHPMTHLAL